MEISFVHDLSMRESISANNKNDVVHQHWYWQFLAVRWGALEVRWTRTECTYGVSLAGVLLPPLNATMFADSLDRDLVDWMHENQDTEFELRQEGIS